MRKRITFGSNSRAIDDDDDDGDDGDDDDDDDDDDYNGDGDGDDGDDDDGDDSNKSGFESIRDDINLARNPKKVRFCVL